MLRGLPARALVRIHAACPPRTTPLVVAMAKHVKKGGAGMPAAKQPTIASFFGGGGATAVKRDAPTSPDTSGATDRDTLVTDVAAASMSPSTKPFKRLRKAEVGEAATATAAPAAEAVMEESETVVPDNSPPKAPTARLESKAAPKTAPKKATAIPPLSAICPAQMTSPKEPPSSTATGVESHTDHGGSSDDDGSASEGEECGDSDAEEDGGGADAFAKMKTASAKASTKKKKSKAGSKGKGGANVGDKSVETAARLSKYDPASRVTWAAGAPVPYKFLADTFEQMANVSARLEKTELLTNVFRSVIASTPDDLLPMVYLSMSQIAPAHEGRELGIGDATLIKALAEATGRKEQAIKDDYNEEGDLGVVAMASRSKQKTMFQPAPLSVRKVLAGFREISQTEGAKSTEKKRGMIQKMLVAAKDVEAGFLVRSLQGKLRIGLAQATVLTALAHAVLLQEEARDGPGEGQLADRLEAAVTCLKQVYSECPSYDQLVPALLQHGLANLKEHCHFVPGVPVAPMLAKPTTGVQEVLTRFDKCEFSCEYKYDGERAQVHLTSDGKVFIYSRNSENNTSKFPDVVEFLPSVTKPGVTAVVLDCEAVAYDREEKKILPFQVLSTRARKGVLVDDIKVQVCLFAFDCLYLNGDTLLEKTLVERRQALHAAIEEKPGKMMLAQERTSRDLEELQTFLDDSIKQGTEGLIVKALDTTYEPSKRSLNWLKLKKDYMEGVGDSLDLVVVGGFEGKGKRTGVYGAFLLACWDDENEEYQTVCKIGTGFSEAELESHNTKLRELVVKEAPAYYNYGDAAVPDEWFAPKLVWEVKCADLSISPVHKAAIGRVDADKGIALRFPRFLRERDDKTPEMATSAAQVADMYSSQAIVQQ